MEDKEKVVKVSATESLASVEAPTPVMTTPSLALAPTPVLAAAPSQSSSADIVS